MADYYTQFSAAITLAPGAEIWLRRVLSLNTEDPKHIEELLHALAINTTDETILWPQFEWRINDNTLYCSSQDYGQIDQLGLLFKAYLRKFDPSSKIIITWAETCTKPRPDEFGGGWMIVTSKEIISENTQQAVKRKLRELEKSERAVQ